MKRETTTATKFLIVVAIFLGIIATALATYRIVMHNIEINIEGDTAYLTVFGQTDMYEVSPERQ